MQYIKSIHIIFLLYHGRNIRGMQKAVLTFCVIITRERERNCSGMGKEWVAKGTFWEQVALGLRKEVRKKLEIWQHQKTAFYEKRRSFWRAMKKVNKKLIHFCPRNNFIRVILKKLWQDLFHILRTKEEENEVVNCKK